MDWGFPSTKKWTSSSQLSILFALKGMLGSFYLCKTSGSFTCGIRAVYSLGWTINWLTYRPRFDSDDLSLHRSLCSCGVWERGWCQERNTGSSLGVSRGGSANAATPVWPWAELPHLQGLSFLTGYVKVITHISYGCWKDKMRNFPGGPGAGTPHL